MKKLILLLIFNFIFLMPYAQRVMLAIHQNYTVPDIPQVSQTGDTLYSSSPIGNQWFKDGVELQSEKNLN